MVAARDRPVVGDEPVVGVVIGSRGDRGAQIALINDLYDAVRPQIAAVDGVAALDFDGAIDLCRKGEKFNRPADADKCLRNLTALSDNFLAN